MKVISKIFKIFNRSSNIDDFKLKIVPSCDNSDIINFRYSTNGGWSWKFIHTAYSPFLGLIDYDWTWERLSYSLGKGNFSGELEMFSSLDKIKAYEEAQKNRYEKGRIQAKKDRDEYAKRKKQAFINANKK
jgi:hypothetical protein